MLPPSPPTPPPMHYRSSLRNLARLFIGISRANLDYIQPADALLHHRPGAMLQKGSLFQSKRFLSPLILNNNPHHEIGHTYIYFI